MDPRLTKLHHALSETLAASLNEDMSWHPPGKWCAAELFEHLYLSYAGTIKGFERVAAAGKPLVTAATWRQRFQTLVVVGLGHMPQGVKAPAVVVPRGLPLEQVRAGIISAIQQMDEIITRCEAAHGSNRKLLDHPILGPLSAAQWKKLHLVHGVHHMRQIRGMRQAAKSVPST